MSNISRIGNKNNNSASSSATQACAACKFQRKKCTPDCLLAPYFPQDRPRQFLNAHKLFGVSNITKIIKRVGPLEKDEAMKTIMFQADARAVDPVGGCFRIVLELQRQIAYHKHELDLVLHQLSLCHVQNPQFSPMTTTNNSDLTQVENTNGIPLDVYDPMLTQDHHHHHHHHQVSSWTMPILQESNVTSSSSSFQPNPNNDHNSNKQASNGGGDHYDQCSINPDMNPVAPFIDVNDIKFEIEELVERRFVPSTELVMSS